MLAFESCCNAKEFSHVKLKLPHQENSCQTSHSCSGLTLKNSVWWEMLNGLVCGERTSCLNLCWGEFMSCGTYCLIGDHYSEISSLLYLSRVEKEQFYYRTFPNNYNVN